MKTTAFISSSYQVNDLITAFCKGMERHGVLVSRNNRLDCLTGDFATVWGLNQAKKAVAFGFKGPILVLERAYLGDRFYWTAAGWNGLNGRAIFPPMWDAGRFSENFGHLLRPWAENRPKTALILGQVPGDQSLVGIDVERSYANMAVKAREAGWDVVFREHPVIVERRAPSIRPQSVPFDESLSLESALAGVGMTMAINSNASVDSLMAGVPAYVADAGSMVYDIAEHTFGVITKKPRTPRLREIACVQWTPEEMASGLAWEHVGPLMPAEGMTL